MEEAERSTPSLPHAAPGVECHQRPFVTVCPKPRAVGRRVVRMESEYLLVVRERLLQVAHLEVHCADVRRVRQAERGRRDAVNGRGRVSAFFTTRVHLSELEANSALSATMGSTCAARWAGRHAAASATTHRSAIAAAIVGRSEHLRFVEHVVQQTARCGRACEAGDKGETHQHHRIAEDQAHGAGPGRAQRHPDGDLARAQGDRLGQDPVEADGAHDQAQESEHRRDFRGASRPASDRPFSAASVRMLYGATAGSSDRAASRIAATCPAASPSARTTRVRPPGIAAGTAGRSSAAPPRRESWRDDLSRDR